jgi:hypothetical protein
VSSVEGVPMFQQTLQLSFTLKMTTEMFAETLKRLQYSSRLIPESRSYTLLAYFSFFSSDFNFQSCTECTKFGLFTTAMGGK